MRPPSTAAAAVRRAFSSTGAGYLLGLVPGPVSFTFSMGSSPVQAGAGPMAGRGVRAPRPGRCLLGGAPEVGLLVGLLVGLGEGDAGVLLAADARQPHLCGGERGRAAHRGGGGRTWSLARPPP